MYEQASPSQPERMTSADYLAKADEALQFAVIEDESGMGLEVATVRYEEALAAYMGAAAEFVSEDLKPDHDFYLKLAACQTKLAASPSLKPYMSEQSINIDRRDWLFKAAASSYHNALTLLGDEATPDIYLLRGEMYRLYGNYTEDTGNPVEAHTKYRESLESIIQADALLADTEELEYVQVEVIKEKISEQERDTKQAMRSLMW
jgi:hypothetical protein